CFVEQRGDSAGPGERPNLGCGLVESTEMSPADAARGDRTMFSAEPEVIYDPVPDYQDPARERIRLRRHWATRSTWMFALTAPMSGLDRDRRPHATRFRQNVRATVRMNRSDWRPIRRRAWRRRSPACGRG